MKAALFGAAVLCGLLQVADQRESARGKDAPQATPATRVTLYHSDPLHPANRVHCALFRRVFNGHVLGLDEAFPLLWWSSNYLLEESRADEVLTALRALEAQAAEGLLASQLGSLQRAVLQHDLWTVFDWAASEPTSPRREDLARALARTIASLALPRPEIEGLRGNYADAISAGVYRGAHDPHDPRRAFLPADLFDTQGPWVMLGEQWGELDTLAEQHAAVTDGRSRFSVFIRLPGDRADTLAYLKTLRGLAEPLVVCRTGGCFAPAFLTEDGPHYHLNPAAPGPPPGSVVALVRRMLLFDDQGELLDTPLVQSVQLRAFLEPLAADEARPPVQAVAEFRLERAPLFAGEAGGLVAIGYDEPAFHFLGSHGDGVDFLPGDYAPGTGRPHFDTCGSCHGIRGVHSINSYTGIASGSGTQHSVVMRRPPRRLIEGSEAEQILRALRYKRRRFEWGVLRGLTLSGN